MAAVPRRIRGPGSLARGGVRRQDQAVRPGVTVRLVDERLSTVDAHRALHAAGKKEKQFRAVVDQAAAVVLLQAALDAERAGHTPGRVVEGPKARRKPRHRGQGGARTPDPGATEDEG